MQKKDTRAGNGKTSLENRQGKESFAKAYSPSAVDYASSKDLADLASRIDMLSREISGLTEIMNRKNEEEIDRIKTITVNRSTLQELLKISKETLYSLCDEKNGRFIRNYKDASGMLYFNLWDVYQAIHLGEVKWRGMRAESILNRLELYAKRSLLSIRKESDVSSMFEELSYYDAY